MTRRNSTRKNSNLKNITIGILSWKSHKTLENTLKSYKDNGLLSLVHPVIYFQERTEEDDTLAKSYGINDIIGTNENVGILQGFMKLVEHTKTKYFIFAECDFELVNNKERTSEILKECIHLIKKDGIDVIRLRDRENPGDPLFSRSIIPVEGRHLNGHNISKNFPWKIETVHFLKDPEKKFPGDFNVIDKKHRWYRAVSKNNRWSNNVFIASTAFLKDRVFSVLNARGGLSANGKNSANTFNLEDYLSKTLKDYTIAAGPGLFQT
jgi:hypothetical protein